MRNHMQHALLAAAMVTIVVPAASAQTRQSEPLNLGDRFKITWTEPASSSNARTPAQPAAASQPDPDALRHRLTVSVLWGPDNSFSGNVIKAGAGTLQGVPLVFADTSYDDVYGRLALFKIGVGYRISPRSEAVFNWVISRSSSEAQNVGVVGTAAAPVVAVFDDYNYWGFEGGQRFFFARTRFTPYVGYTVGINRFDAINADFAVPAVGTQPGVVVNDGQFFDSSWAFSFGPTGGVLIGLGELPVELMAEISLRYMGGLSDVDPLSDAGLRDINSESGRWSLPILFGGRIRF